MRFFKRRLQRGMVTAEKGFANGVQKMADALERAEIVGGHIEWTPLGGMRIVPDSTLYSATTRIAKAWDISFVRVTTVTTATAYHCIANIAGKTKEFADIVFTMPAGTAVYIGVKININDLTAVPVLVAGTTIANTVETSDPADDEVYLYYLLYHASKAVDDWVIDIDYRTQLTPSVYG